MQCVILAGGLGTRMWPRARRVPKTLLPVAGHPFAHWQLSWLAAAGVDSVVYCIGHLGEQIRAYVGDGAPWGLSVRYSDDGGELRGTAGALRLADANGLFEASFLLLYGDSWLQVDPAAVMAAYAKSSVPALMTVFENHELWDTSNAVVNGDRVTRYEKGVDPRPAEMYWIDYGLSALSRQVLGMIGGPDPQDLTPLLTQLARTGELAAYKVRDRFYEIGSPEGLATLEAHFLAQS